MNYQSFFDDVARYITQNHYKGYDPYDIKSTPFLLKLTELGRRNRAMAIFREIVFEICYTFPLLTRRMLHIQPQKNAKAMGLFATSYTEMSVINPGNTFYSNQAEYCRKWLLDHPDTTSGLGWGYPFDWQSSRLIPRSTPNGIVTTAVGEAFWVSYLHTKKPEYLEICEQICHFLVSLPVEHYDDNSLCFSYTPLFKNHVHNLNLFVADFLIKVGRSIDRNEWIESGRRAVAYTLKNQHDDGSFDYNGPPDRPANFIDNYHTGFVLRMMHSINKHLDDPAINTALRKGYEHYISNFFLEDGTPKLLPNRIHRIDIHSAAEAVNCLTVLSDDYPDALPQAQKVLDWTIHHMYDPSGFFYYATLKSRFTGQVFTSKIPYVRWGQAWMMRALSRFILHNQSSIIFE